LIYVIGLCGGNTSIGVILHDRDMQGLRTYKEERKVAMEAKKVFTIALIPY